MLANELKEICGKEPDFIEIRKRVPKHIDALWKSMITSDTILKAHINKAFEDVIGKMADLRGVAGQVSMGQGYAEKRYCSGCGARFCSGKSSSSSKKRRNHDDDDG